MRVLNNVNPMNEMLPSPFNDQKSANAVRHQLSDLSQKIDADVQPVYTSQKIKGPVKPKEHKPSIVNQENIVYYFKCGLCDADYVAFRSQRLDQESTTM